MTPQQLAQNGTERGHQMAFFAWCAMCSSYGIQAANDPRSYSEYNYAEKTYGRTTDKNLQALARVFAIHNAGHGDAIRGARAKAEGVKAGVPDIFFPCPANDEFGHFMSGMFIEMKKPDAGVVSKEQTDWIKYLREQEYFVVVCYGWDRAVNAILMYLGIDQNAKQADGNR